MIERQGTKWLATWALALCAVGTVAQRAAPQGATDARPAIQDPRPQEEGAPKLVVTPACKAALAAAAEVSAKVKGLKGPDRLTALETAARAYEKVLADFGADRAGAAEAAFQTAELWRRHGSLEAAEAAYGRAVELDRGRWAERAGMGRADMLRRLKKMEPALAAYRAVVALGKTTNRTHDARVWVARCLDATDAAADALQAYRDALEAAATPRQTIDAGNWLAKALIVRGDLDGADGVLAHVTRTVADVEVDRPEERQRLDKALDAMSARRQLQRARDKAQGAAGDAVRIGGGD